MGWNLLSSIILFQAIKEAPWRYLPLLSPVLMICSVVLTANHYVIDALVGAAVAVLGLYGGARLTDLTEQRGAERREQNTSARH